MEIEKEILDHFSKNITAQETKVTREGREITIYSCEGLSHYGKIRIETERPLAQFHKSLEKIKSNLFFLLHDILTSSYVLALYDWGGVDSIKRYIDEMTKDRQLVTLTDQSTDKKAIFKATIFYRVYYILRNGISARGIKLHPIYPVPSPFVIITDDRRTIFSWRRKEYKSLKNKIIINKGE